MTVNNETKIVQRAQTGDREAFAILHDRHRQAIYTYIYYRVEDQATADDLTADVFVRMVEKIGHFRPRGKPFISWLYTIARNLLTDHYRKRGKTPDTLSLDDVLVAGSDNPSAALEGKLAAACLRLALRYLTEIQKQVIIGRFLEARSNAEVARILGKTEGAVKALQHRALAALRRAIEKEGCYEP